MARGGSRGRKRSSGLSGLTRRKIGSREEMDAYYDELLGDSDRVCATLACAALDGHLRDFLHTKFVVMTKEEENALFYDRGILSSFGAKIDIAFAMGLIPAVQRDDLNRLRRIRNAFASFYGDDFLRYERNSGRM